MIIMKTKICTKCGSSLPATSEFFRRRNGRPCGLTSWCKGCLKKYDKSGKNKIAYKKYQESKKGRETRKEYFQSKKGKQVRKKAAKKFQISEKCKSYQRIYQSKYQKKNKLSRYISYGIWRSLKSNKGSEHWEDFVTYTVEELALHLQGTIGLTICFVLLDFWQGFYGSFYHVDHKRPVASFDKQMLQNSKSKEFQECWSLTNLQLLPAKENLKKWKHYKKYV